MAFWQWPSLWTCSTDVQLGSRKGRGGEPTSRAGLVWSFYNPVGPPVAPHIAKPAVSGQLKNARHVGGGGSHLGQDRDFEEDEGKNQ
ncbi:hypothetical protein DL546_003754 [Coniochaeta pulveracea]|uniref:Uncharacterized protein n=1 Tax=Coniochaeta pulveracea TaxID=177199 RepID=A0A420Y293_9PEZI|nr:hypothetical protein DL546_003754 [Coniochaeta pulveracea]